MLRWRLLLEEFSTKIIYIKGTDTDTADDLSRISLINSDIKESKIPREHLAERYCADELYSNTFTLKYKKMYKYQHKDNDME